MINTPDKNVARKISHIVRRSVEYDTIECVFLNVRLHYSYTFANVPARKYDIVPKWCNDNKHFYRSGLLT